MSLPTSTAPASASTGPATSSTQPPAAPAAKPFAELVNFPAFFSGLEHAGYSLDSTERQKVQTIVTDALNANDGNSIIPGDLGALIMKGIYMVCFFFQSLIGGGSATNWANIGNLFGTAGDHTSRENTYHMLLGAMRQARLQLQASGDPQISAIALAATSAASGNERSPNIPGNIFNQVVAAIPAPPDRDTNLNDHTPRMQDIATADAVSAAPASTPAPGNTSPNQRHA